MNEKVNILVLDTEVYSNTGGQQSKGHTQGRRGPLRCRWQAHRQKRPRPHSPWLTAPRTLHSRIWLQGFTDRQGPRGKPSPTRHFPCHRLLPCIEHGYELGSGPRTAKTRRGHRLLAPLPLRSAPCRRRRAGIKLDSAVPKLALAKLWAAERRFQALATADPEHCQAILAAAPRRGSPASSPFTRGWPPSPSSPTRRRWPSSRFLHCTAVCDRRHPSCNDAITNWKWCHTSSSLLLHCSGGL